MKVSDYIVEFFINKGIKDIFGYPGGMITHFMDSAEKNEKMHTHILYHEQGASFAVCGYAQATLNPSVAYSTSGPGATNLITGICNAYFDSIPTIFLTGQVNTGEAKGKLKIRQRGFQETDIVKMAKGVTKFSVCINDPLDIRFYLEKAYCEAILGRPGPVLLDIPMNVQRADVDISKLRGYKEPKLKTTKSDLSKIIEEIKRAEKPCVLLGAGVKGAGIEKEVREFIEKLKVPSVSSMPAIDILASSSDNNFGFIGAYGHRVANFIVAKCDLLLVLGSRLSIRQTGIIRKEFAPNAKIVRIDIDKEELQEKIREEDVSYNVDLKVAIKYLLENIGTISDKKYWLGICNTIKDKLASFDKSNIQEIISSISETIEDNTIITTDVGQNQVWMAQFFKFKEDQKCLTSAGHGAMGYSLPAAIGAYYASGKKIFSFSGDGGIQMNIQELQVVGQHQLPIKILVLNNKTLGMIRHFQEMYFDSNYAQTTEEKGYKAFNFKYVAKSYNIKYSTIANLEDIKEIDFNDGKPELIEVLLSDRTYVFPKLEFGKPNQDQEPLLDRKLYAYLMGL